MSAILMNEWMMEQFGDALKEWLLFGWMKMCETYEIG